MLNSPWNLRFALEPSGHAFISRSSQKCECLISTVPRNQARDASDISSVLYSHSVGSRAIFGVRMEAQSARANPTRNRVRNAVDKGNPHGKPNWLSLVKRLNHDQFVHVCYRLCLASCLSSWAQTSPKSGFPASCFCAPGPRHSFSGKVQNCGLPKVEERMQHSEI